MDIARAIGNELISQTDTAAIFGRTKADSEDKYKTLSAASAMNWFLGGLKKAEKL